MDNDIAVVILRRHLDDLRACIDLMPGENANDLRKAIAEMEPAVRKAENILTIGSEELLDE